jgi:uncharacterized protein (DUF2236 family)
MPLAETATYTPQLGVPLGPDSMTWNLVGDRRWMLCGMRAGLLQTMHPAINQALKQHDSTYFQGPMKRILRSVPQIQGVVFDADAAGTAAKVRKYHKPLSGTLPDGTAYHALNPDVFYWPHATFFEQQIRAMECFGTPRTPAEKEWLVQLRRVLQLLGSHDRERPGHEQLLAIHQAHQVRGLRPLALPGTARVAVAPRLGHTVRRPDVADPRLAGSRGARPDRRGMDRER